jgi:hypothetical protein
VHASLDTHRARRILGVRVPHLHRFRWAGYDPFSSASLYRCSCGVVRPAP